MNLRSRQDDDVEINLTSLIDVVFLLLIFFMVSTTFVRESAIRLTLPEASETPAEPEQAAIEVAIDDQGRVFVDGRSLVNRRVETIMRAIGEAAAGRKDPPIVIKADARTEHQHVVTAMDAARQLGFLRVTFATQLPAED